MANHKQAEKRYRQSENRRANNMVQKSAMRTKIKAVRRAAEENDSAAAKKALKEALPFIDKTAGKGVIHKNTAARTKSRLVHLVGKL